MHFYEVPQNATKITENKKQEMPQVERLTTTLFQTYAVVTDSDCGVRR